MAVLSNSIIRFLKPLRSRSFILSTCRLNSRLTESSHPLRHQLDLGLIRQRPGRSISSKTISKLNQPHGHFRKYPWMRAGLVVIGMAGGVISAFYLSEFTDQPLLLTGAQNKNIACCEKSQAINTEDLIDPGSEIPTSEKEKIELHMKLYQYESCPFCCKTKAFLDYYGIQYEKIEVNPLMKKEIKFSKYRKVPIAIVDGIQLNDSSLIISVLRSYMLGKGSLETLLTYYPTVVTGEGRKKRTEYTNRHNVMYMEAMPTKEEHQAVSEEVKWRKWVDQTFIHTLSPNIYRTLAESFQAFEYFSEVGHFSAFDRFIARNCGAVFMFILSKNLKKRYNLKDDVRESFYDEAKRWMKAVGKRRKFMGGDKPNLADLSVYGVLSGIEGLEAFQDLMKNTDMKPWYDRVKKAVQSHQGRKEYEELTEKLSTN